MVQPFKKTLLLFLKRLNIELPFDQMIPLSIYPREIKTYAHKTLYRNISSCITHLSQNMETIQMSINRQLDKKLWYIHTMVSYLAIKKNEDLIYILTQMNPKNMLSEKKVVQRHTT